MAAPILTGTPVALALGTSATPGAQAVTVPADAQAVVVLYRTYSASGSSLSLASSFAGTFSYDQTTGAGEHTGVAWALVSATGSQTLTPTWTTAPAEGPIVIVAFVRDINTSDWYRDSGEQVLNSTGTAASVTIASAVDDLVLALDSQYDAGNAIPSNPAGWTSRQTQGVNSEGGRLRSADTPGASTTTATGQSTSYSGVAIISIKAAAAPSGALFDPAIFSAPPFDTGAGGGGGSPYTAEITPSTYTATAASITALQKRLAATTAASYTTAASQITANVGRLAGITPAGYATTYSTVEAIYGGGLAAYLAEITPASYTTTAASIEGLFFRRAEAQPAAFSTTPAAITANVGRIGAVTPASYGTTPASITAAPARLAIVTPATYSATASQVGAARTALADVTVTAYAATFSLITADYSGLPPPVAADGLAALLRRRRR